MSGGSENLDQEYGDDFMSSLEESATASSDAVLPLLKEFLHPTTVVDVGCGGGHWLEGARRHFDAETLAIDGPWNKRIVDSGFRFLHVDLERPIEIDERFDLVLCLEVAEHVSKAGEANLLRSLTSLGDVVLFSAAVEGQDGTHHINCRWQSHWVQEFARLGFEAHDVVRPRIWYLEEVAWWYRQNMLLFVKRGSTSIDLDLATERASQAPFDLVHPKHLTLQLEWRDQEVAWWRAQAESLQDRLAAPPNLRFVAGISKRYVQSKTLDRIRQVRARG